MNPAMNKPSLRHIRSIMYIILGLAGGIPMAYLEIINKKKYILPGFSVVPWAIGGAIYIGGAINYALRFPERLFPGKFDLVGSSHNIFHCCIVFACAMLFNESLNLFYKRKQFICPIEINY